MGMYGQLRSVSPAFAARLRAEPALVAEVTGFGSVEMEPVPGLLYRALRCVGITVEQAADRPAKPRDDRWLTEAGPEVGLDKAWHAVHWILTGRLDEVDSPLGRAILGGEPLDDEVRLVPVHEVAETAAALASFAPRWPGPHADLYPSIAWDPADVAWALAAVGDVARAYAEAAAKGHAMLVWVG